MTTAFQLPVVADARAIEAVSEYLAQRRLAMPGESLTLERVGEGNMNCVWRAILPERSLVLKQARPWVEKYPQIAAPVERAEAEARFYRFAGRDDFLAARMPRLLDHDPVAHLLVLEDLTPAVSLELCYRSGMTPSLAQIQALAQFVGRLHGLNFRAADVPVFSNGAMRALNHAHVFELPLHSDGPFDALLEQVTPGLAASARGLRSDADYVRQVEALGRRYLGDHEHPCLLHGDLFLGSLLGIAGGELRVIDPEFSFGGEPEFDQGIFYAHLILSGQSGELRAAWLEHAVIAFGRSEVLVRKYAGVEIMRRLIGVAQLPLSLSLAAKHGLLAESRLMVLGQGLGL